MRFLLAAGLALCACKKPAPVRACDVDLSGVWLNASDRHFAYRLRDHGELLRGEFLERSDDGALKKPSDPVLFELHRTQTALAGVMKMTLENEAGRRCPVEFGIRFSSCRPQSLQAVVEMSADVEADCTRKQAEPRLVEYTLERDQKTASR